MQESILRRLAGWTGGSDMPAVYIHVRNKDVEKSQLALQGKAVAQSVSENLIYIWQRAFFK